MKRRTYKDPTLQHAYNAYRDEAPVKIWSDGKTYRWGGSMFRIPFWRGFDRITLNGKPPFVRNSPAFAMYMAGRDYADDVERGDRAPLPANSRQGVGVG